MSSAKGRVVQVADAQALTSALRGAKPGDEIVLADGVYEGGFIVHGRSGTPDSHIVIRSANPGRVTLTSANPASPDGFKLYRSPYWELRGLVARDCLGDGFNIASSEGVTVSGCSAFDSGLHGLLAGASPHIVVSGGEWAGSKPTTDYSGTGIYIAHDSHYPTVSRTVCYGNAHNGIQVNGSGGAPIKAPAILDIECYGSGIGSGDGHTQGAALNLLVIEGGSVSQIYLHDNVAGGIALMLATDVNIDGGSISFAPGVGRACISGIKGARAVYRNLIFTPGKGPVVEVSGGAVLTDGGGNVVVGGAK